MNKSRGLATGGDQVGPGIETHIGLDLANNRTKTPAQPVPFHGAADTSADGIPDTCPVPVVTQIDDRHGATSGAPSGPPQCLERCPVGYAPGHAGTRLAAQAVSL